MLYFKNGVLWGGYKSVLYSLDTGKTWSTSIATLPNITEAVQSIDFFDSQNGLVRTNNYIYITTNGGTTWSQQSAPGGQGSRYTAFVGSANAILSLASQGAYLSGDGGVTWNLTYNGATPNIISYRSAGTLAIFEGNHIDVSLNSGQSWTVKPVNNSLSDSYSFMWDPCDSNTLYLANEDYFRRVENWSEVFVTTDRGTTWISKIREPWSYFNGAMAVSQDAAYFMTVSNGISRTTDYGATWSGIGGPNNNADSRWLVALTSNLLIGVDQNGDVWRTDNSGGFGITTTSPVFTLQPPHMISTCQRDTFQFIAASAHCHSYTITKAFLSGPDTLLYTIHPPKYPDLLSNESSDSIHIGFHPNHQSGSYYDTLHISWLDAGGNPFDSIFFIQETVNPAPVQFTLIPPIVVFDTVSPCHPQRKDAPLTIKNIGCDSLNISFIGNQLPLPFSIDSVKLPVMLAPDSTMTVKYHFTPTTPGFYNTNDLITAEWKGVQFIQQIQLNGRETTSGFAGAGFDTLINFDTVSACSPNRDTTLTVMNLGCDTMRILSGPGNLGAAFSLDAITFPVIIPPGGSVKLHLHFHPPSVGSYSVSAPFLNDWLKYNGEPMNFTFSGVSSRSAAAPLFADTILNFRKVSICNPLKDTSITLKNRSCDTLRINSGPGVIDSNFSTDNITYPIILSPDSFIVIHFHFHPSIIGEDTSIVIFRTLREGTIQNISLTLAGESSQTLAGPIVTSAICTFDTITTCSPAKDTLVALTNRGCDTLRILSGPGILGIGFSMDPMTYPISLPPDSSVNIHFHFTHSSIGASSMLAHFVTDRENTLDSVDLTLNGYTISGSSILSLQTPTIAFASVSICSQDSSEIIYTNSGCDTLFVQPNGMTGDPDFLGASGSDQAVWPGDTIHIKIHFLPQQKGLRNGFYTLRYHSRFGATNDTLIPIQANVINGAKQLTQSLAQINFGTATLCTMPDTMITLHNLGCDTLTVSSIGWQGSGFMTDAVFPIIISPGKDTVIHIYSQLDTSGSKLNSSATITIVSSSDTALPPVTLARGYSYPKMYPLRLRADSAAYRAGDTARIHLIADSLPTNLTLIEGSLSVQDTDMMTYLSAKSPNLILMQGNQITITGNPIRDSLGIVAQFYYKMYLTKDSIASLSLSGTSFNSADADYEKCIAYPTATRTDSVLYSFACGDKLIQAGMNNDLAAQLVGVYPNPAQNEISLDIITLETTDCQITISDESGNTLIRKTINHPKGRSAATIDLHQISSGAYFVKVDVGASHLSTTFIKER